MERCWIALGGNLGHVPDTFAGVEQALAAHPEFRDVLKSPLFRTAPMGSHAGGVFWNAVLECRTSLEPSTLLLFLQHLETRFGRVRTRHWGPRTLDLDILYYGERCISLPDLQVPHPGRIARRFVLDPLCELSPDWIDPIWHLSAKELQSRLSAAPRQLVLPRAFAARDFEFIEQRVASQWPDVRVVSRSPEQDHHGLVLDFEPSRDGTPVVELPAQIEGDTLRELTLALATAAFDVPECVASASSGS